MDMNLSETVDQLAWYTCSKQETLTCTEQTEDCHLMLSSGLQVCCYTNTHEHTHEITQEQTNEHMKQDNQERGEGRKKGEKILERFPSF